MPRDVCWIEWSLVVRAWRSRTSRPETTVATLRASSIQGDGERSRIVFSFACPICARVLESQTRA